MADVSESAVCLRSKPSDKTDGEVDGIAKPSDKTDGEVDGIAKDEAKTAVGRCLSVPLNTSSSSSCPNIDQDKSFSVFHEDLARAGSVEYGSSPKESSHSSSPMKKPPDEFVVGRSIKTKVLQRINGGSFGQIHLGIFLNTGEEVAVKLEKQRSPSAQLLAEGNVLRHLEGGPGIPKVHWFGVHEPEYNVMVMELLGPSLQDLFAYCKHKFSVKTVLMLADQMFDIIYYIHKKQYIYRDIKPDNFVIGVREKVNKVYILDFGLAKKLTTHRFSVGQLSCALVHPVVGTVRYLGIHAHLGQGEWMRDDLESLAYVFIYFLRGKLPWQSLPFRTRDEKFAKIKEMKARMPIATLCEGLPKQFAEFLEYARHLRVGEYYNFKQIKEGFRNLAKELGISYDNEFDWIVQQKETGVKIETRGQTDHGHDSS